MLPEHKACKNVAEINLHDITSKALKEVMASWLAKTKTFSKAANPKAETIINKTKSIGSSGSDVL